MPRFHERQPKPEVSENHGDDATTEERAIQTSSFDKLGKAVTKLPMPQKLKFWIWKKADWNYNSLLKQFFKGAPKEVYEQDPRFKVLLKYGEVAIVVMVTRFESK
ncbi:hypothetical protein GQ600_3459 [Phytophthora cactorum]|nr:hypothetical protein GQ600_3459 [Phytophthora cactorum]